MRTGQCKKSICRNPIYTLENIILQHFLQKYHIELRHFKLFTLFFLFSLLITHSSRAAVYSYFPTDSYSIKKVKADSLHRADSIKKAKAKKAPLESKVDYHARDSIRLDAKKRKVYLYGDADVKYENLELKAAYIDISLDSNIAFATGIQD